MLTVMFRVIHSGKGEGLGWRGVRRCGMLDVIGGRGTSKKHGRVSVEEEGEEEEEEEEEELGLSW